MPLETGDMTVVTVEAVVVAESRPAVIIIIITSHITIRVKIIIIIIIVVVVVSLATMTITRAMVMPRAMVVAIIITSPAMTRVTRLLSLRTKVMKIKLRAMGSPRMATARVLSQEIRIATQSPTQRSKRNATS